MPGMRTVCPINPYGHVDAVLVSLEAPPELELDEPDPGPLPAGDSPAVSFLRRFAVEVVVAPRPLPLREPPGMKIC